MHMHEFDAACCMGKVCPKKKVNKSVFLGNLCNSKTVFSKQKVQIGRFNRLDCDD